MAHLPKAAKPTAFSSILERPAGVWPGGARLAVYIKVSVEDFAWGGGGPPLAPGLPPPDVMNTAWRDYGNRVGVFRLLEALADVGAPAAFAVNSMVYETCEPVVSAVRAGGHHEVVAHGVTNTQLPAKMTAEAEAAAIAEATATITTAEGATPAGWLSPAFAASDNTVRLLADAGYSYTLDWAHDDQPSVLTCPTSGRTLLNVPCSVDLGDMPCMLAHHMTATEYADTVIAAFDELLRQAVAHPQPLVFCFPVHTFLAGQPSRLPAIRRVLRHITKPDPRVWVTLPRDIAAAWDADARCPKAGTTGSKA